MRPAGAIGPRRRRTDLGRGPRRRLLPSWEEAQAFIYVAQPDPLILSAFRGDVGGPVLGARYVVTSPLAGREGWAVLPVTP